MKEAEIDLPVRAVLKLALEAHRLDITLNQHINNILINEIKNLADPIYQAIEEIGE